MTKEEKRAYNRAYYLKHRAERLEESRARAREWGRQNPERARARAAAWSAANPERKRATARAYAKKRDPDRRRQQSREKEVRRRGRQVGAEGSFGAADIQALWESQNGRCVYCDADLSLGYEIDHKTPLSRGGSNWPSNLQFTCPMCNRRKYTLTDEEMRQRLAERGHGVATIWLLTAS